MMRAWDLDAGTELASQAQAVAWRRYLELAPQGWLATLDGKAAAQVRSLPGGELRASLDAAAWLGEKPEWFGLSNPPLLSFGDQGRLLAVIGNKRTGLWRWGNAQSAVVVPGGWPLTAATMAPRVALVDDCKRIAVHSPDAERPLLHLPVADACPRALALSPDGRWLLELGGKVARVHDLAREHPPVDLHGYEESPRPLAAFAPDGRTIATPAPDGTVLLWDPVAGRRLLRLPAGKGVVTALAFRDDGLALAVAYEDAVLVWPAAKP
jgi:hypothetical protein